MLLSAAKTQIVSCFTRIRGPNFGGDVSNSRGISGLGELCRDSDKFFLEKSY